MEHEPRWRGQMVGDPGAMDFGELNAFLAETRYAAVTTFRRDGSLITVYMGFEWDGDAFYFCVRGSRFINKRLERDPRAAFAVSNEQYPAKYVIADGAVEIVDDPDLMRTKRMFMKYMDPANDFQKNKTIDIDAFWENYLTAGRTLYRLTPVRLKSEDASKWSDESGGAGASDLLASQ